MQWRELQRDTAEVIVYVRQLNQLKDNNVSQPIEVLNRHTQTVTWLALAQNSVLPDLELGQYYKLSGTVYPAHSYATAGVFDVEQWYLQQNIMGNFWVTHVQPISAQHIYSMGLSKHWRAQHTLRAKFRLWVEQQRYQIRAFIQQQSLQHKGLLLALLTGDKSLLSSEIEDQFQRFGISHLLAISGPHVLIFAAMLCWCLDRLINLSSMKST
ncbi:ComEC/Rec2 family competence protein [Acinetobacter sp. A2]|uniref:ComEC/Rec2 family competence protein n=1 Tax=Acinetobacter sp. A2 TaxID=362457 RepID=UPI003AF3BF82